MLYELLIKTARWIEHYMCYNIVSANTCGYGGSDRHEYEAFAKELNETGTYFYAAIMRRVPDFSILD